MSSRGRDGDSTSSREETEPSERPNEYRFWGVLNRYVSGFEEIIVDELGCIGGGDTREEVLHDVKFKICDEIARLHDMGQRVTALSEEEASRFAEKLRDDLRGDPESEVESWSLVRIAVDMENRPPGKTKEELDSIAAFEMASWRMYLAETEANRVDPAPLPDLG